MENIELITTQKSVDYVFLKKRKQEEQQKEKLKDKRWENLYCFVMNFNDLTT